jgi:uncharacterized membrane protein
LGLLFVGKPWLSLMIALLILVGTALGWLHTDTLFSFVQQPLHLPPEYTEDLVTLFPWFAVVLIGLFIVAKDWHLIPSLKANVISNNVSFLGRHSLLIYIIHQPILFGGVMLFAKL